MFMYVYLNSVLECVLTATYVYVVELVILCKLLVICSVCCVRMYDAASKKLCFALIKFAPDCSRCESFGWCFLIVLCNLMCDVVRDFFFSVFRQRHHWACVARSVLAYALLFFFFSKWIEIDKCSRRFTMWLEMFLISHTQVLHSELASLQSNWPLWAGHNCL